MDVPASVLKTMRNAARDDRRPSATRTTSSTCRSRSPASPARPSSGPATARAACRSTRGSSGFTPKDPGHGSFDKHRLRARRPRLRLRLADQGQRRDRDREVLPPAALRHREGLPACRTSSSAATSTRATDGRHPSRTRARHRLGRQVRRGGLARLRPAAGDLRRAARRDRARDGLHEQRRDRQQRRSRPARRSPAG